ncbi:MAG: RNA-directed DNA polymerase [Nanoarchaeota archaeon]
MLRIIQRRIHDNNVLWLIKTILNNYHAKERGKGMPLGNLTSQFFANVYLHEMDQYIKNSLKAKQYIRYVDDFVILHQDEEKLKEFLSSINSFLQENLKLELHPEKSQIREIWKSVRFLGLRIFTSHKLLAKRNMRKFQKKLHLMCAQYAKKEIEYDAVYDFLEGWVAYSKTADTYNLRKRLVSPLERVFGGDISVKEYNRHLKEMNKYRILHRHITT